MALNQDEALVQRLTRLQKVADQQPLATCIGCGCDDHRACCDEGDGQPCCWLRVDRDAAQGVCSTCPDHLERWDAGHPSQAVS